MRIAVVGGGIGGLCTAIGLGNAGATVFLFEKAEQMRARGSGLSIFGNGLQALESLGLGDAFRKISTPNMSEFQGGLRRPNGTWISIYPNSAFSELRVVDRAHLHEMLVKALPDTVHVMRNSEVVLAAADGNLTWRDGQSVECDEKFDLVIGADGLNSKIRASFVDDPGVAYSGYSTWRGITAKTVDLGLEAAETWGVRQRFGVAPLPDGRVYWFAVISSNPEQRYVNHYQALNEVFGAWHKPIPQLLASTPEEDITYLPIHELAGKLSSYHAGRVVLVGDSAHAMTPNLGQGGGQSMEDAATITRLLAPMASSGHFSEADLISALRKYDELRLARTQKIAQRSRLIGSLAHATGPRLRGIRDFLLKATPASSMTRQFAWLQDWTPPN